MFFLYHILSMCMSSCTYILKNKTHEPCKFYPDELLVLGDDMNATNINSFTFNATRTMMNLMGLTFADSYRVSVKNDHYSISYKILKCRDTTWAKKVILDELTRKYPYEIIDTIEKHKVYDMIFLDTTIFYPRVYDDPMMLGYTYLPAYELTYNREYTSVFMGIIHNAPENNGVRVKLGQVKPLEMDTNRYHVLLSREFTDFPVHLPRFFEYLRDEYCVDVNLVEDYTIPIKLIRLK